MHREPIRLLRCLAALQAGRAIAASIGIAFTHSSSSCRLSSGKHTMGSMRHGRLPTVTFGSHVRLLVACAVLVPFAKLNTLTLSGAFPAFGDFQSKSVCLARDLPLSHLACVPSDSFWFLVSFSLPGRSRGLARLQGGGQGQDRSLVSLTDCCGLG